MDRLAGRDAELAVIDAALAARGPRSLAVTGDPGIGKTSLLRALAGRARRAGIPVLAGRATELEHDIPFAVWADALDPHVRPAAGATAAALGPEAIAELATALPALRPHAAPRAVAALVDERRRTAAAMRALLEHLAVPRGVVVLLDDLHWADAASVDVAATLLRRPPAADVLLCVAVRPRQAPERLAAALDRAGRDGGLVRLAPAPLSAADADAVLGAGMPAALRARLLAESGGNPFYLEQLARSVQLGGRLPRGMAEAIAAELAALPGPARAALDGAAIAGDPFGPDVVELASGLPPDAVLAALDELRARDLVHPGPVPRTFALRHPLVREAVLAATDGSWRKAAHGRVARALRSQGGHGPQVAHHIARSASPGDADAVALLRAAAQEALPRAPDAAAGWLRTALELLGPDHGGPERLELLEALSTALAATGRPGEAHAAIEDALALVPTGPARTRLVVRQASLEHGAGRHGEARGRLLAELERLPGGGAHARERVGLLFELSVNAFHARDPEAMTAWATRARADATAAGDRPTAVAAAAAAALAAVLAGRTGEAATLADAAAEELDALADDELAERLEAPHLLTLAEMYVERFEPMVRHAARAIAVARASGRGRLLGALTLAQGFGELMLGRLADACRHLGAGVEAERLTGNAHALSWVLMNETLARCAAGDLDAALASGRESVDLVAGAEDGVVSAYPGAALAAVLVERGEAEEACAVLLAAAGGPDLPLLPGFWRVACLDLLCRAQLGREDLAAAARAVEEAEAAARALGQRLPRGWAARASAAVHLAQGAPTVAAGRALAGADDLRAGGAILEAALAELLAGRALAAAGNRRAALAVLERAAAEFEDLGAVGAYKAVTRELRRLGRRDAVPSPALTAREREVAVLAAAGSTNRQIAERLVLSEKTVEGHLRRVFAKLRVRERGELPDALRAVA